MPMPLSISAATAAILACALSAAPQTTRAQQSVAGTRDTTAVRRPAVVKHTVKRGDTLWDLAQYYLKDPHRWPEVFHANTDIIKNPHWIYPGQVLTIDGAAVKDEVASRVGSDGFVVSQIQTRAESQTVFAQPSATGPVETMASIAKPPVLTVRPGEYEAAPYMVDPRAHLGAGKLLGAVETLALGLTSDAGFRLNDRLYLTAPAGSTLRTGDFVLLARVATIIPDIGRVVEPTGIIRIDSAGQSGPAIGSLMRQFEPVLPGQLVLTPGQDFAATTRRPVPGVYPLSAKLIWIKGSPALPSIQTYVILGASSADGVTPGDQFTLFDEAPNAAVAHTPPVASGTVTIVRVTPQGATGLIVTETQPHITVGMPTHLTAKMP